MLESGEIGLAADEGDGLEGGVEDIDIKAGVGLEAAGDGDEFEPGPVADLDVDVVASGLDDDVVVAGGGGELLAMVELLSVRLTPERCVSEYSLGPSSRTIEAAWPPSLDHA